jgi:Zn-dependent protease with chaperone function
MHFREHRGSLLIVLDNEEDYSLEIGIVSKQWFYFSMGGCAAFAVSPNAVPPQFQAALAGRRAAIIVEKDIFDILSAEELSAVLDHEHGHIIKNHVFRALNGQITVSMQLENEADLYSLFFNKKRHLISSLFKLMRQQAQATNMISRQMPITQKLFFKMTMTINSVKQITGRGLNILTS